MKKFKLLTMLFALLCAVSMHAENFAIDFMHNPYEVVGGGDLPEGVEVTGTPNGDISHGYRLPVITIPVTAGNYKVTMGTCTYSHQDGTVKTEDGSYTYATLETNTGVCYHQNTATNVVVEIFNVPSDQTIKVYGAEYTPYFAIEKMAAVPAFTDFEINFQSDPYNVISGAKPAGTVIAGSYNDNQHGYHNVEATVPVEAGTYRLTLGACGYGNGAGNVMSETNVELASFNQKLEENNKCYHQNTTENIVSVTFTVDIDQTITIDCGEYTPYMKLEKISAYHVVFALGDAEGSVPAAVDVTIGDALTMPVNKTMYYAGYTLTGWSDGVNTYAIGDAFTPTSDVVLTPVFTANAVAITAATEEVIVRWNFGEFNGAPSMHWEGNSGFLIAQATIGGNPIDVRLDINATNGKFFNSGRGDIWAQVNANTTFTFPAKDGATVEVGAYTNPTDYSLSGNVLTVNDISNNYYSYLEVTYPASIPTFINITANVDPNHAGVYYATFYHSSAKYALPNDGTKAFVAELSGTDLVLHEIASGSDVLPADVAVILQAPSSSITLMQTDAGAVSVSYPNCLEGTDAAMAAPANCYVISGHSSDNSVVGVGFYQFTGTLKPNKAYTIYSGGLGAAPKRLRFVFDAATGVENVQSDNVQSTKVIENGQLVIIKNGVKYNAHGQIVK